MNFENRLGFLDFAEPLQASHGASLTLPSWLPNFTQTSKDTSFQRGAAGTSSCKPAHINENFQLEVSAVVCGTIEEIGSAAPPHLFSSDWENIIPNWESTLTRYRRTQKCRLNQIEEDLLNLLRTGFTVDDVEGSLMTAAGSIQLYREVLGSKNWSKLLYPYVCGRAIFSANLKLDLIMESTIGIGPSEAMPGDIIAVLLGYSNPVILRPIDSSMTQDVITYRFVGSAYALGLMDCEALLGPIPEKYRSIRTTDEKGRILYALVHRETGARQYEDPRLGPLPHGWYTNYLEVPGKRWFWKDNKDDKTIFDPRLQPEELKKRGVDIKRILLA